MSEVITASGTEGTIAENNLLVWNQGLNPLVNFNFMLRVEAIFDLPCKSVHAFSKEMEYEYYQEGGLNDYVHMLRKPISQPFTLEVERYVGVDYIDPLPLGAELSLPVFLFVGRNPNQFIPGLTARTYIFTGCTVMKKTFGELNAENAGILTETVTIGYREMLCIDIPWSANVSDVGAEKFTTPANSALTTTDNSTESKDSDSKDSDSEDSDSKESDSKESTEPESANGDNSEIKTAPIIETYADDAANR